MNFLEKLDFMMKKLNINKSGLSERSGVPYTTIDSFYKKGFENTKMSTIKKIADALDVSLDYLMVDSITNEDYGKTNGFLLHYSEMEHIKKYRVLGRHGKEVVDSVLDLEYQHTIEAQKEEQHNTEEKTTVYFPVPEYSEPVSAGVGEVVETVYPENINLIKEPPRGTSFIAHIRGDSMEPTFQDGDMIFVHAQNEIRKGQIGVFFMDGMEFVKELGDRELISHNPEYEPRAFTEDIRCQGLVLGICDESYLEE